VRSKLQPILLLNTKTDECLVNDSSGLRGHAEGAYLLGAEQRVLNSAGGCRRWGWLVKGKGQRKKRENLKGWGRGEIALIKNSQDTFPSHGRRGYLLKRKYTKHSNKDICSKPMQYSYQKSLIYPLSSLYKLTERHAKCISSIPALY